MRVFRADVDIAFGGTYCQTSDGHALNQHIGVTLHGHAVREGAGVTFIGIAHHVLLCSGGAAHSAPFDARRKSRATAATQARVQHFLHHCRTIHGHGIFQTHPTAVSGVIVKRQRAGDTHAGKGKTLLFGQIGNLICDAKGQGMLSAI